MIRTLSILTGLSLLAACDITPPPDPLPLPPPPPAENVSVWIDGPDCVDQPGLVTYRAGTNRPELIDAWEWQRDAAERSLSSAQAFNVKFVDGTASTEIRLLAITTDGRIVERHKLVTVQLPADGVSLAGGPVRCEMEH